MVVARSPIQQAREIPWVPWRTVRKTVDDLWDPEHKPHHAIVGLTGSGKSYLAINGILKMCDYDRVLIVDSKGDDPTISRTGRAVKEFTRRPWYSGLGEDKKPRRDWYRLVVSDNMEKAREQVGRALNEAYDDGDWVIYVDETWDITSRDKEVGLGLGGIMSKIWRKGRSRHVSMIAATQTPVEVPRLFYDQSSFAWIGAIRDEDRQKRLLEIGGLSRKDLSHVSELEDKQWLLAADSGKYFAKTVVNNSRLRAVI